MSGQPLSRAVIPGDEPPAPKPGGIAARALGIGQSAQSYLDKLNPEQRVRYEEHNERFRERQRRMESGAQPAPK